ncbi:GNAT family N-acetyltransferase [Kitasatospora sp. NPDC059571]|uniref:GNAT family N-acetyltransferase n=1 Tax=Kitasatospora sp. NPDC059571 TaxID=3346871 RepID=UPI0036CFB7EC
MPDLPSPWPRPGYRSRPATAADAPAMHALVALCESEVLGRAETGLDVIVAELAQSDLDPALDTLLVHAASGELAACAWVVRGRRSAVEVHPGHRGIGLGAALLQWAEERARGTGSERLVQTAWDEDRATVALLRSRGYAPYVSQWQLEIALPTEPEVPAPPAGVTVRPFHEADRHAAHRLTEDAFDEWQQRRKPYDEWARLTVDRATFAPGLSPVALVGDEMVGAALCLDVPGTGEGYVERLAVRRDHRNRGIARILLREAFRGFHRHGYRSCTLWTHSRTGALALYERVGMNVRQGSTVYAKALAAG